MNTEQQRVRNSEQSTLDWVSSRFTSLAGALAAIYAYSYLLGYAYLTFYFRDLRALWAIDLFDATTIAQTPAIVAALLALTLASFVLHGEPLHTPEVKVPLFLFLLAVITYAIHLAIGRWMKGYTSYWAFGTFLLALIAALMTGMIYLHKLRASLGGKPAVWTFMLTLGALALIATPATADVKTKSILATQAKSLPTVQIENVDAQDWHLLRAINGSRLLLIRPTGTDRFEFRVIEASEAKRISENSKPDKAATNH